LFIGKYADVHVHKLMIFHSYVWLPECCSTQIFFLKICSNRDLNLSGELYIS
jgi:hypothetical protein